METRPRIVIAGAGPVGLVAAHALAQLGYQPVIYEKRLRPSISSSHDAPGYDSIATLGPRPWGSRERTRGVALHGSVIDAIRQLSKIDLVEYPGLHQVRRLISNIDGESTSAEFPGQSGWWRAENSPFTGASNDRHSLTAADVCNSIIDEVPLAMIGIAEIEHYLLTESLAVSFGTEVVQARPAETGSGGNLDLLLRDRSGRHIEEKADLLIDATGGRELHSRSVPAAASSTSRQKQCLLTDLGYSLNVRDPGAVLLWDVAWSTDVINTEPVLGVYGATGFGSFTGVLSLFPEFSKATIAIPDALADDAESQFTWVQNVASAMGIETTGHDILFEGKYWAFQSQLSSVVSPISPFALAIGDAYGRTTPMNGRNFQTAVPFLMSLVDVLKKDPDIIEDRDKWSVSIKRIGSQHEVFFRTILDMSDRIGRPIDEAAYEKQRSALSRLS